MERFATWPNNRKVRRAARRSGGISVEPQQARLMFLDYAALGEFVQLHELYWKTLPFERRPAIILFNCCDRAAEIGGIDAELREFMHRELNIVAATNAFPRSAQEADELIRGTLIALEHHHDDHPHGPVPNTPLASGRHDRQSRWAMLACGSDRANFLSLLPIVPAICA